MCRDGLALTAGNQQRAFAGGQVLRHAAPDLHSAVACQAGVVLDAFFLELKLT
jgi:hypothetical protein